MSLLIRALLAFCLIITPYSHAYECVNYFEISQNTIEDRIRHSRVDKEWAARKNVFSESFPSTAISGLTWLTLVQLIKHQFVTDKNQPIFTDAFWITVPTDIMITIASHALSLKEIPVLQKFMNGQYLGAKFEYFARTISNTLFNSGVILTTWAAAGIDINSGTVGAALTLCAAVYSVLQITKPFLFKTIPSKIGVSQFKEFNFPQHKDAWSSAAKDLKLDSYSIEAHFTYALDAIIFETAFENRSLGTISSQKISDYIRTLKDLDGSRDSKKIKKLRRSLVQELITVYKDIKTPQATKQFIEVALRLDSTVTGEQSVEILSYILKTHRSRQMWLYTASFIDQAIAVGIAGGVFLYSTTHWAMSGDLPKFWEFLN